MTHPTNDSAYRGCCRNKILQQPLFLPYFSYTYGAHGEVAQVKDNVRGVTVTSEYDVANRPMRKTTMQGSAHVYTGEVTYDQYNNLSSFKEQVGSGRTLYTTTFTHDNENRPTALNFGGSRSMGYTYDGLGRMSQRTVNAGGTAVPTTFTYLGGGHGTGSTTPLVQKMTQQGKTLTYAYDDAGNILSVNDGSKTVSYSYDLLGQLIRANDPYDTTAGSAGTTWVYSYDLGGNMTSKKAYAYTTGTVGTAVQTISYTYGDSNWKDKLTAYNGAAISYDAIGNPTSDGTWTYTWAKGRQLQSMSRSGTSVSYTYNEDGLRVQKNVSGTVTSYILHGKNVVQLTQGSSNLHFFYGADGSPAVVVYNGAGYGYVKNLQGDVVSIVNSSGTEVVHYTYDAWGKLLSKTGTLATTLGTLNPFRYRGYVYDEETGLYYLRSRYYNPTWGRFVNGDGQLALTGCSIESNIFAYCINSPIINADENGYVAVCCFDDNGNINTLMSLTMSGGVGGGGGMVGGYVVLDTMYHMDKDDWINEAVFWGSYILSFAIMKGAHGLGAAFLSEAKSYYSSNAIGRFLQGVTVANGLGVSYVAQGAMQKAVNKEPKSITKNDFIKDFVTEFIPIKIPTLIDFIKSYLEETFDWEELLLQSK